MNVGNEPLIWSAALETGIEKIDQQHRMLVAILNQANRCFAEGGSQSERLSVMRDLVAYTVYHFDCEEALMDEGGYIECPEAEMAHISEHRSFAFAVTHYQRALEYGEGLDAKALFSFLNNWLLAHVMGTDRKLADFLKRKKQAPDLGGAG